MQYNPSLRQEPRNQSITFVPVMVRESLFSWLEHSGRFRAAEVSLGQEPLISDDLDEILDPDLYSLDDNDEDLLDPDD